jgi:hypothetical protein
MIEKAALLIAAQRTGDHGWAMAMASTDTGPKARDQYCEQRCAYAAYRNSRLTRGFKGRRKTANAGR